MDPIVGNSTNINQQHSAVARERSSAGNSLTSDQPVVYNSPNSIIDLSALSAEANNSGDEIRGDVIARAEKLLSDPNWLNDINLDSLADRILSVEEI